MLSNIIDGRSSKMIMQMVMTDYNLVKLISKYITNLAI